jgi:uncharacterized membrane protein
MERMQQPYDTIIEAFATHKVPYDIAACYVWLAGTILSIYLPVVNETFLRVVFGIPVILFIPGYALIAALFPAAKDLGGIERIALSFGLSIAVVPLIGLALNYTPWGIRLDPIVTSLAVFTICMCLAAQYRRACVPAAERFTVPFGAMGKAVTREFFPEKTTRLDRILSLVLLIAILAAVATTVYVVVVPKEGEKFTEFFILGSDQKAADYPSEIMAGQNSSMYIGIGNHEYKNITYTVEIYLESMTFDEKTNTSVLGAMDRIDRFTVPVPDNQTVVLPYSFTAKKTTYNRIEFLLFNATVPGDRVQGMDRINQSYRDLHLWITVTPPLR